jgi:hypothetical protein
MNRRAYFQRRRTDSETDAFPTSELLSSGRVLFSGAGEVLVRVKQSRSRTGVDW